MFRPLRAIGTPIVSALALSAACTVVTPSDDTNASAGSGTQPEGGKSQGGSTGKAGGSSKAGSSSGKAGSGVGGSSMSGAPHDGGEGGGGAGKGGDGSGGDGGSDACPGCASGFCLSDGTCVECLPQNDHCPDGKYCTDSNECAAGCKANGAGCASGRCDSNHNCESCIADSECLAPLLCSAGECRASCTAEQEGTTTGCDGGLTCCSLRCASLAFDSDNCGSCGQACGDGQFCGATECPANGAGGAGGAGAACVECHDSKLGSVCAIQKVVVILDSDKNPSDGNRAQGRRVGEALKTKCSTEPVVVEAEQASLDALNITTGKPVSGPGELLVVAGGPFFQSLQGYLENQRIAPLYWYVNGDVTEYRRSSDDSVVLSRAINGVDHLAEDDFIIQFSRDAASGSLVLNVQGFWLSGTVAGGFHLAESVLDQLETFDKSWYAYTWTDGDGDLAPDVGEFQLVSSGD